MQVSDVISITAGREQFYKNHFDEPEEAIEYCLEFLPAIYEGTLRELKTKGFSRSELCLCIDVVNALWMTGFQAGRELSANVVDSIELEHADTKWGISKDEIIRKLRSLSLTQNAVLCLWAKSFWMQTLHEGNDNLDAYVAQLAG